MSIARRMGARAFLVAALACGACSTSLPSPVIHTAASPDAPFGRYRTFSFEAPPGAPAGYILSARSIDAQQKMRPLIAAALADKGFVEVGEGADFIAM